MRAMARGLQRRRGLGKLSNKLLVEEEGKTKRRGRRILTAAESAGTTFPFEEITQPLGTPGAVVYTGPAVVSVVAVATHGQPVWVMVESLGFPPRPAGMEGEAEVAAGMSAEATDAAAPPEFPLTFPPTASMDCHSPELSPYLYCVPVE